MPGDMDKRVKQRRLRRIKGWAQEYDSYESWGSDALKAWKGHGMILLFFLSYNFLILLTLCLPHPFCYFSFLPPFLFSLPLHYFIHFSIWLFLLLLPFLLLLVQSIEKLLIFIILSPYVLNQWFMISEHASVVEWLMRPAWWAGGRGFESRPPPNLNQKPITYNNILPEIQSKALIYLRNGALCLSRKAGCTRHFLKPKSTPPKNPRQNKHI